MQKNWKNDLERGDSVRALFMDLLKAFDTINHDLLQAKFEEYSFLKDALICAVISKKLNKDL